MPEPLEIPALWPANMRDELDQMYRQIQLQRDWAYLTGRGTWTVGLDGANPLPPPPITGEVMISFCPSKEEIDKDELKTVRKWILSQAMGEKQVWPGYQVVLRVNGKGRYLSGGTWEIRHGDTSIYVGNGNMPTPLWAPSCLMGIARFYRLDDEPNLVQAIRDMLATIVAKEVIPAMTELAAGYNGSPVIEIAVNKKERLFVGRYKDEKGNPGSYRYLSGEEADVTGDDWVKLKM